MFYVHNGPVLRGYTSHLREISQSQRADLDHRAAGRAGRSPQPFQNDTAEYIGEAQPAKVIEVNTPLRAIGNGIEPVDSVPAS